MINFLIIVDLFILVISTGVAFFFVVMLLINSSDSLGFENEKIIDERFVKPNHYSLMRFIIPLAIGVFIALNSFIFLVILILIQG